MIKCKGRNGWFAYDHHYTGTFYNGDGFIQVYSKSPHTRSAPLGFDGPVLEVVRLFRQIARELEADYRAAKKKGGE